RPADFAHRLPAVLRKQAAFGGPIVRAAEPAAVAELKRRLGLDGAGFCLVSTPGGGGFEEDTARFVDVARRVHERLSARLSGFRHVLVLGPNSSIPAASLNGSMTVLQSEPEMGSLIAGADAGLSAGGYNSVSEIRLAKRPAFFRPGRRPHDDQPQRVEALAARGLAMVVDGADADAAAARVAEACLDGARLAAMR